MESASLLLLILAVAGALAFEFVNGFHDTANAVATVIYTRSLRPLKAVVLSGLLNFAGVMMAGVGVAYSIVHLFPMDSLTSAGTAGSHTVSLIFAVLGAAMIWNLGTWYVGIPASSSHALIGSILGASMGYCLQNGVPLESGVPWDKARQVMAALLLSPMLGFASAALLLRLVKHWVRDQDLYRSPRGDEPPPWWIRGLLIATCGGVSFAHGSNDGQKGMGLVMLILIGLAPASFCLNLKDQPEVRQAARAACLRVVDRLPENHLPPLALEAELTAYLQGTMVPAGLRPSLLRSARLWEQPPSELSASERMELRRLSTLQIKCLKKLAQEHPEWATECQNAARALALPIEYVADWVKISVALALGLGTMVGWKRIVVTVGEKIGKSQLTYAQGATAQLVAATTILLADVCKMPVSTTHVLSSGIAGSMAAESHGLQRRTLAHIALAWALTLPVCITLSLGFYLALS